MPSRRSALVLSSAEKAKFLQQTQTIIVVTIGPNGFPHPMPMWFHADSASICYCTTFRKSQKVENVHRDQRATLLLETGHTYSELKGLVIYANTEIIDDYDVVVGTMQLIYQQSPSLCLSKSLETTLMQTAPKRVVLKFYPLKFVSWDHRKLGNVN